MNIFKQSVWEFSKSQHKTKKTLKSMTPKQIQIAHKQISVNSSALNKADCTNISYFFNARTYFVDGSITVHPLIDDIIDGVSKLDTGGNKRGLSKSNLLYFLSSGKKIYLSDIQKYVNCEVRQARNYLKALKLCVLFIERLYLTGKLHPLKNNLGVYYNTVAESLYSDNITNPLYNTVAESCLFDNCSEVMIDIPYDDAPDVLFYEDYCID